MTPPKPPTSGRPTKIRNGCSRLASILMAFALLFGVSAASVALGTTASVIMASPAHADTNTDDINGAISWAKGYLGARTTTAWPA